MYPRLPSLPDPPYTEPARHTRVSARFIIFLSRLVLPEAVYYISKLRCCFFNTFFYFLETLQFSTWLVLVVVQHRYII